MNNKIFILVGLIISMGLIGCKKFLDVTPKANLAESQLFTSESGFQQALTGVYSQLASRNLYGDNMTMGFASALAQNYGLTSSVSVPLVETAKLNYTSPEVQTHITNIWTTAYSAIAGINKVLDNTIEKRSLLSDDSYALIRGEALGLRAFLHFDLLRLFGKDYGTNSEVKAIPYKKDVNQNANIPATTAEVVNLALADLKEAGDLLKLKDPIVTTNMKSRRSHLNYYGVKALEARIRLYMGDKIGAAEAAKIVVNSGKYIFVTQTEASAATSGSVVRDRLYLNEQIFMIRVRDMVTWTENYFRFSGSTAFKLTRTDANFKTLYETASGGGTDLRYLYRIEQDGGAPFPSKYWQTSSTVLDSTRLDQYVPAIRLAEMYYILAETAETPAAGIAYLNTVRQKRNIPVLTTTTQAGLTAETTKEYQKEFYAEGQLFFYYKRIKSATMQFRSGAVAAQQYVLPIPDSELEFNPNY